MIEKDPETFELIGAAMEVHRELGGGMLEAVYQNAFEEELKLRRIPYFREQYYPVIYKGILLNHRYRVDFECFGSVIVELKSIVHLSNIEEAQVIHYLKLSGLKRGLLLNFGTSSLQYKRLVN